MGVGDFVKLLRGHWRFVLAIVVIAVATSAGIAFTRTPQYEADTQVFVSVRDNSSADASNPYQGNLFSQDRVKSYARIVTAPIVTQPVVNSLRLTSTADQLGRQIDATVPTGTVLIDITVHDVSAQRSAAIANEVSAQFARAVAKLEAQGGKQSPIVVSTVRPAGVPNAPSSPRITLDLILGLLVGLAVGIGSAALRGILDTRLRTGEELQEAIRAPNLGIIGFDASTPANPLVPNHDQGPRGEAFRTLRTNLRFADVDNPLRILAITSSVSGEGKSTTACNLALTIAETGATVVLIEADLRRPRVADYMGLEGAAGLTDVLIGRLEVEDVLQQWGGSTMSVLAAGPLPPNPSEMLGSQQMSQLLTKLRDRFDMVVIDVPPLLPVTDAAVVAATCDGTLVIARYNKTTREQLSRAGEALQGVGARVLGTVLNMAPRRGANSYGYGERYTYNQSADRLKLVTGGRNEAGGADNNSHHRRSRQTAG